jgi:formylglycine-generating enzyme required for sulfatase activity
MIQAVNIIDWTAEADHPGFTSLIGAILDIVGPSPLEFKKEEHQRGEEEARKMVKQVKSAPEKPRTVSRATMVTFSLILVNVFIACVWSYNSQAGNVQKEITNDLGMSFVYIPSGAFTMGSPTDELGRNDDETQHQVTLTKGFYMQTTEVTQGQWQAVMGNNPSQFQDCGDDCPVEKVSWDDAQAFIKRLNAKDNANKYRLPTEAEWEYACRAGTDNQFSFGDNVNQLGEYAWYRENSNERTHPVAQKKPNPWGLFDMHGNVWEWCQGWYGDYPSGSLTDPKGPSWGASRVLRGGSWIDFPSYLRSAVQIAYHPTGSDNIVGFRLARTK